MSLIGNAQREGREPVVASQPGDRRYEWHDNVWPHLLKQSYLLNSQFIAEWVEATSVDEKEKHKLRFFARQFIDAMSPANFGATNPEAWKMALESGGQSVRAGVSNLLKDVERGRISITDESAFEVGRNVAVSEGAVVFENELFQLIQYAPLTPEVASRPLLIVPPCIRGPSPLRRSTCPAARRPLPHRP